MTLQRNHPMQAVSETSTGIAPRTAATLAYAAWWITGLIFWLLEKDRFVRFHAAQSITAFGTIALLIVGFGALAGASLSFVPTAFVPLLGAAFVTWIGGVALWLLAMWKAASGDVFRIPLAADWADRLMKL